METMGPEEHDKGGTDNESLEERCWQEEYKGDSRKWLIRDASAKHPRGPLCSAMKESYLYPERENSDENNLGKKRKEMLLKFYEEAIQEATKESQPAVEPAHYCTEYDVHFKAEGFEPEDEFYKKNTKHFHKYPLYSSPAVSYYNFNYQQNPNIVMPGLTRVTDRQNIFKKNAQFSKPIQESLDFVEL